MKTLSLKCGYDVTDLHWNFGDEQVPDGFLLHKGDKYWFLNGLKHRSDGPAVERNDGDKEWRMYGKFHRENGPAFETMHGPWGNPYIEWYLDGHMYEFDEWLEKTPISIEEKVLLKLRWA